MTAPDREVSATPGRDASPSAGGDASSPAAGFVPGPRPDPTSDSRFSWGLILDMFDVLERHGYRRGEDAAGEAIGVLFRLAGAYEGARELS